MEGCRKLRNVIDTTWSSNLAYAIGLIASDGCLSSSTKRISFVSKDKELVDLYRTALSITSNPYQSGRGGTTEKNYWSIAFKSRQFHDYLVLIGITPAKSKTIKKVQIPDVWFPDFLRGIFDGDGTFWTTWDRRWPNSFVYYTGLSSASLEYTKWLKKRLSALYGVNGCISPGKGAYTIRYVKGDSRKLFKIMYYRTDLLYLKRKYAKIKTALELDAKLHQSKANAVVAQR